MRAIFLMACQAQAPAPAPPPAWERMLVSVSDEPPALGLSEVCRTDCEAILTAASDPARTAEERAQLWWSVYGAGLLSPPVLARALPQFRSAQTPPEVLRPLAYLLLRGGQHGPLLDEALHADPRPAARAAVACALLTGIPPELADRLPVDDVAQAEMGGCPTPWRPAP